MTTDEPLLLRAICEVPDDDTRRLGYADHLDEMAGEVECRCQGDPKRNLRFDRKKERWVHGCDWCSGTGRVSDGRAERAEFVRVQVELAGIPFSPISPVHETRADFWFRVEGGWVPSDQRFRYTELRRRESELLPLCPLWFEVGADQTEWTRGFVSGLTWNTDQFMRHAAAIFGAQPVTTVTLVDVSPEDLGPLEVPWRFRYPYHSLPHEIWRRLQPHHFSPTEEGARTALSAACVSLGRTLAHLPPLVAPAARPARVG